MKQNGGELGVWVMANKDHWSMGRGLQEITGTQVRSLGDRLRTGRLPESSLEYR